MCVRVCVEDSAVYVIYVNDMCQCVSLHCVTVSVIVEGLCVTMSISVCFCQFFFYFYFF